MYQRPQYLLLSERLQEPARFIQVITGPRQVGKTTLVTQYMNQTKIPCHYASADSAGLGGATWIRQQWETARFKLGTANQLEVILILDEIQKIAAWADTIKGLWDDDAIRQHPIKLVILGSSQLLVQKGLTESLAGRFEVIRLSHWSLSEMEAAFGITPEEYVWFGGYPGAAGLINDELRWKDYITNSLIETSISKDILMMTRIHKPALLRNLFMLGCNYSGQILSYTKMLGQLHDAGNTTTLADYLNTLGSAGLLAGLEKFSGSRVIQRSSSPKFQVLNTALISAQQTLLFRNASDDKSFWGRMIESAVGSHLVNQAHEGKYQVSYWREGSQEVDFVIKQDDRLIAIEVKSGWSEKLSGMSAFCSRYPQAKPLLVGYHGIPWQEFLRIHPGQLFTEVKG